MRTPDGARPEVITAKWKTALDSNEEHFGTITLDDAFELTLKRVVKGNRPEEIGRAHV